MQNSYSLVAITPAPILPTAIFPVGKEWKQPCNPFQGLGPLCLPLWLMTFPAMPQPDPPQLPPGRAGQCRAHTSVVANVWNRVWPHLHTNHSSWTQQGLLCSPCPQLKLPGLKKTFPLLGWRHSCNESLTSMISRGGNTPNSSIVRVSSLSPINNPTNKGSDEPLLTQSSH